MGILNLKLGTSALAILPSAIAFAILPNAIAPTAAIGQTPPPAPTIVRNPITVLSDIQESNSETGTIVARGNVFVDYPARNLEATSTQAQYFSNERRLILSGDVLVLQEGNTLRAETVTYLVDEGRLIALPLPNKQVESVYLIPETQAPPAAATPLDPTLLNGTPTTSPQTELDQFPPFPENFPSEDVINEGVVDEDVIDVEIIDSVPTDRGAEKGETLDDSPDIETDFEVEVEPGQDLFDDL